nr:hypothetical protein [Tanacetum cinerariifolium]
MELYMLNRQHDRMILESVEHGPLLWPTIEEDGVTRLKKYFEFTHKVAKDLWERIQMLMQGTSLTKHERECKLYNEFDKFAYWKGETLCDFYLRFSLLLNDRNMYNMKLKQFQVNTKFLNTLPPKWNPLALVSQHQLHRTTYQHHHQSYHQPQFQQQASTYQTSPYATSYYTPQFVSQGPSSSTHSISYPITDTSSLVNHNAYMASSSTPHIDYALMVQHSSEYSSPETRLVIPVFQNGDDPIDAIIHMMSFLTAVVTSRYPATNNQLRTSSNPYQQATINNGRVTIQPIQGRENFVSAGSSRPFTSRSGGAPGKQRVIVCYNCKGEGHMSKQCTKPKRKQDAEWFKDKVLLVQAQANGQVLQEEELEFLADPGTAEANYLTHQEMQVPSTSEQSNILTQSKTKSTSDSNIISYSQYMNESQYNTVQNFTIPALHDDLILSMIEQLKTQVVNCTKTNQDNKHVNELLTAKLERYINQERVLNELKHDDKASTSYESSQEIESLKHTLSEHLKEKESLEQKITILKNDFQNEESRNIDKELALEK